MLLAVVLSFGAVDALIPLLVIMILIAAAAGLTRGYNLFRIFGIGTLAGIGAAGLSGKGSLVGKTSYSKSPVKAKGVGRQFAYRATGLKNRQGKTVSPGKFARSKVNSWQAGRAANKQANSLPGISGNSISGGSAFKSAVGRILHVAGQAAGGAFLGSVLSSKGGGMVAKEKYNSTLKKYENASEKYKAAGSKLEQESALADREKYAHQLQDMAEKENIPMSSPLEHASTSDAISYTLKEAQAKGRPLTQSEAATVRNALIRLNTRKALGDEFKEWSEIAALGGVLNSENTRGVARRLSREASGISKAGAISSLNEDAIKAQVDRQMSGIGVITPIRTIPNAKMIGSDTLNSIRSKVRESEKLGSILDAGKKVKKKLGG
ncbi:MAG: hypothetical protein KGI04_01350 [Candidatus Micrarchaeota archaeon]|nr:hypothetical protein [Candidatus Micrarchaeota archaeon]